MAAAQPLATLRLRDARHCKQSPFPVRFRPLALLRLMAAQPWKKWFSDVRPSKAAAVTFSTVAIP